MKTHSNQVAAFGKLIGHCNDHGATFNPSKESMKSTALTNLLTEAQKSIQAVHKANSDLVSAINTRNRTFEKLPKLGTRIIGALHAMGASPDHIADVNRIRSRFRFQPPKETAQRIGPVGQTGQTNGVNIPPAKAPRGPISQLGFNNKIETLAAMIELLGKDPAYVPNEADLTLESLNAALAELREKQKAVGMASQALYIARLHCNTMLFSTEGIYGTSTKVKDYIRSVFGYNSVQYQVVRKIKFKK